MDFEWDERKRIENLERRELDFRVAVGVFDDPDRFEWTDLREDRGESRRLAVGNVDGEYYIVAYTMRNKVCRIITAWRLGAHGKARYQAIYERAVARDEGEG